MISAQLSLDDRLTLHDGLILSCPDLGNATRGEGEALPLGLPLGSVFRPRASEVSLVYHVTVRNSFRGVRQGDFEIAVKAVRRKTEGGK